MIEYIKGTVQAPRPTTLVLEANGVGYLLAVSLNTSSVVQEGEERLLYIHEVIREDTYDLFGFATEEERELFRLLITVKGIGPSSACTMLSGYSIRELAHYIASENAAALTAIKGIGSRTAERIIVELKSKIATLSTGQSEVSLTASQRTSSDLKIQQQEAEKAFVALGYTSAQAKSVVSKILKQSPTISLNDLIRQGLRMI